MISFLSSLEIINVVWSDSNIFLKIAASVNLYGIKTILANGFNMFFIKGNSFFSNGHKSTKKPPDCPILCNWVFDDFMLANEPFAKG